MIDLSMNMAKNMLHRKSEGKFIGISYLHIIDILNPVFLVIVNNI